MNTLLEHLKTYLYDTLSIEIETEPFRLQNNLPFFLTDSYLFRELMLLNQPCLLMIAKDHEVLWKIARLAQ